MAQLPFSPRRYTNRYAVDLARRLAELTPGGPHKVLFAPGGAEAISMALKLARTATGKLQKYRLREPYWEGHDRRVH